MEKTCLLLGLLAPMLVLSGCVQQGSLVVCKSNEEHGMEAVKDMVVLAVIARDF